MSRYHFHTVAGARVPDREGIELPDIESAREAAVRFAGELLRDDPGLVRDGEPCRVEVTTGDGALVFTFVALALTTPSKLELVASCG